MSPSRPRWSVGSWTRNIEGCIATFDADEQRWSVHFHQPGYMQAVADYADSHGAKVVTLSTPETIHRDLQGTRTSVNMRHGRVSGVAMPLDERVDVPERAMLGAIGRRDLLLGWEAKPKHG